jgi:hypothetical protein
MSETVRLGDADVPGRILGLDRLQLVLLGLGTGLLADALLRTHLLAQVGLGLVLLAAALPAGERCSVAERAGLALGYAVRSHVSTVALERGDPLVVHATSSVSARGYALLHRGRLDLSGADLELARNLAGTLDALATSPVGRHASLHVWRDGDDVATLLCLDAGRAPEGWRRDDDLLARVAGVGLADHLWLLERLSYVRTTDGVCRVLRVRDYSAAAVPLLAGLQRRRDATTLSLHADVLDDARARRRVERLSHAATSNGAAAGAWGFRETSRTRRRVARTLQREARVAEGRALVRLAVFVTVRAAHLDELAVAVDAVVRTAREAGLVLERGAGRQARWFAQSLPGGPGW